MKEEAIREFVGKKKYNPVLIHEVQPQGNLKLNDERYIKSGDGYTTCIQVYELPDNVQDFWLEDILNRKNVIGVADISTKEKNEALKRVKATTKELRDQWQNSKTDDEEIDASTDYTIMRNQLELMMKYGEDMKQVVLRLYVSSRSTTKLDKEVEDILSKLETMDIKSAVYLDETYYQYKALFTAHTTQLKEINKPEGIPMPSHTVSAGYPFNFEQVDHPFGLYFGKTSTGGLINFDPFYFSSLITAFDGVISGDKGQGKSTFLKMAMTAVSLTGNYLRVLDKVGEMTELIQALGGKVIYLDGKNGIINWLHIWKVSESEQTSFSAHLSKLSTLYSMIKKGTNSDEEAVFEKCLRQLYVEKGLWSEDGSKTITGLSNESYPTFGDLLDSIRKHKESNQLADEELVYYSRVERTVERLVQNYPQIFCGTTNLPNLHSEKAVVFNVRELTTLDKGIYQAMLYNVTTMFYEDMLRIGTPAREAYQDGRGKAVFELEKLMIYIDEAHEFINTDFPEVLRFVQDMVMEDRKYFTGLWLASPPVRHFMPEGSEGGTNAMKSLFEQFQYKVLFRQDGASMPYLRTLFADALTDSQLSRVPNMTRGEAFMMADESPVHAFFDPTSVELELFKGGI